MKIETKIKNKYMNNKNIVNSLKENHLELIDIRTQTISINFELLFDKFWEYLNSKKRCFEFSLEVTFEQSIKSR